MKAWFISKRMIVDLTKVEKSKIEFDLEVKPGELDFESEYVSANGDLNFRGELDNQEYWTEVSGQIDADLKLACGRCLEPVESEIENEFEIAFITPDNYSEERETELEVKELPVSIFEGNEIDLVKLAQEQIMLSLPSQTLCREDCKGLCTKCGINKNFESCDCDKTQVDSRWEALKQLKIDE